jgi:6-phosphogluconate dehydrogenase
MTRRLGRAGFGVVGFDLNSEAREAARGAGAAVVDTLDGLPGRLSAPRTIWIMLPAGDAIDGTISSLAPLLGVGDVVVDGGNSDYRDTLRRAALLEERRIHYVDVGTSGGVHGEAEGFCLMVGGNESVVQRLTPYLETLAPGPERGWGHVGPSGAGHFVKMVHNGIEYGMMQAYAEGLAILEAREDFALDLEQVTRIWTSGSVVRSWLLGLIVKALEESGDLSSIAPIVADTGMGRWTVREAIDLNVAAPVITAALLQRIRSRDDSLFGERLLSAMRQQFGGHAVTSASDS